MDFCGMEKLSLVDFDDNLTCTLFMAGCPFRCPFCHNGDLVLHPETATPIPFAEILDYLGKRKGVLDAVCITGGEPTLMPDLEEKIKTIRDLGYIIKLDSNGFQPHVLRALIEKGLVDYVAMDIKNCPEKYELTCGTKVDMHAIEESVRLLMTSGIGYEFRTTTIEEFHSEEDMEKLARWIAGASRYFIQKYTDSEHCIRHHFHALSLSQANKYLEIVRKYVPNAALRGYDD